MYNVDKESAIRLVINSTQEYFNSASNYYDPDMDFARACLQLIDLNPNHISHQEYVKLKQLLDNEYNLINAMKLINDFNLNLLPVQVRLNQNRIDIVKDILSKNKGAYAEYEKLLQLAKLLSCENHAKSSQEFECGIMLPICQNALENNNLQISLRMCDTMMHYNYSKGILPFEFD
jgi:hypothetical protein